MRPAFCDVFWRVCLRRRRETALAEPDDDSDASLSVSESDPEIELDRPGVEQRCCKRAKHRLGICSWCETTSEPYLPPAS